MANMQASNNQENLTSMLLSPEAKEFIPRQFTDHTSNADPTIGAGLLGAGPGVQTLEENILTPQDPINGVPSYMTTCYPFVAGSDPRFGNRTRFRGKYPQTMYMQHLHPMTPGMPRNRFPFSPKGYQSPNSWGDIGDMYQHFGSLPNGMPFDGGTYQNGFLQQTTHAQISPSDRKQTNADDVYTDSSHLNGMVKSNKTQKSFKQDISGKKGNNHNAKTCSKNSTVQTDFPDGIANATLEEVPNALFNTGLVAYKDHHRPSNRHNHLSSSSSSPSNVNNVKEVNSVASGYMTVSNGTNPDLVTSGERSRSPSASSLRSRSFSQRSNSKVKDEGQNFVSMQDSVTKVPLVSESHPSVPVTLSYARIAQGNPLSSQNSQNRKQNQVAMVTTAKSCDTVSVKKSDNINKTAKGGKSSGRLGNVNVAEIMEDLERADKTKNEIAKTKNETNPKNLSAYYDQIEVRNINKPVNNSSFEQREIKDSGIITSSCACPSASSPSLYSKVVEHNKPMTLSSKGQQVQVKGQGYLSVSEGNRSDLDPDKKGQSLSDNNNNNQVENGQIKKKRRRRRRRKKKSGEANEEEDENEAEEITLHFEDEEEFPDLSGLSNCDTTSSLMGQGSISYSEILRNNNPVQSTKTTIDENSAYITGASPVKESRTSRKRRKRREVANKAADAEMAEIGLEQHMLELKMKQKLPLAAKKSVSPVRNTATQGVWKLTPSSASTSSSSSGKKVSLLLPGTVASEPAHTSTPHQPNTSAVKQPGILKTSQSSNTVSGTSNISGGGNSGSSTGTGKKSKQPITYDLGLLIDAAETKKEQPSKKDSKSVVIKKDDLKPLNILDSSAPTLKRGKERETPKTKKPSPLKKVILKEREEKKRLRMLDEDEVSSGFGMMPASAFPNSPISAPVGIGVVSGGESDLSQDASFKGSMDVGLGTPASAELSPISQPSPSCMSPISPGASPMSSGVNSPITGTVQQTVKLKIHSRRFREYCNQVLDKEIDNHVTLLLQDLVRFQDKQYHKDPVKAKSKRRFVLGLREVTKHLKLRKIKCVVISPNLEKIQSKGGLDDALNTILELCNDQKVPFIFALGRRALGRACAKLVPVSVVGVFNYEGSEENFRSLVALTEKARDAYREMIVQIEKEIAEHPPRASVPGVPHIFAHMGHSRTPSGCSVISFTSSILSEPISENYPHSEPETDNRGYEIEKDEEDDDRVNDNGKDPYEADDEGGSKGKHKTSDLYPNDHGNSGNRSDLGGDRVDSSNRLLNNVQSGSNKPSETKTGTNRDDSDLDDFDDDDDVGTNSGDDDDEIDDDDDFVGEGVDMDNGVVKKMCSLEISDTDQSKEGEDTVEELPTFIDSVHNFDPFCEILSQHSSKTMENGEDVMSTHSSKTTHSSRTLGDGSGLAVDKVGKLIEPKSVEKVTTTALKGKPEVDKDLKELRTRSWVKEAQTLHFNDQLDRTKDCDDSTSSDCNNHNVKDSLDVAL